MKIEYKIFEAEVKASNQDDLTVEHFISSESKDRGGDIMRADGMKIKGRVVVLFAHGRGPMGTEPIARPVWIKKGENAKGTRGILAKTQFYPDDLGKRLWDKAANGWMPNWSVGFRTLKEAYLEDGRTRDVTEWELLEYSPVGVPMNPDAQGPVVGTTPKKDDGFEGVLFKYLDIPDEQALKIIPGMEVKDLLGEDAGQGTGLRISLIPEDATTSELPTEDQLKGMPEFQEKPYPNEHACRLKDPKGYDRIRRQNDKFGTGIHATWGVKGTQVELQAIRFDAAKFTADQAKKWLKDHEYKCMMFEAASGKEGEASACTTDLERKVTELESALETLTDRLDALGKEAPGEQDPDAEAQGAGDNPPEKAKVPRLVFKREEEPGKDVKREALRLVVKDALTTEIRRQVRLKLGKVD